MNPTEKRIVTIVSAIILLFGGYMGVSTWLSNKPKADTEQVEKSEKASSESSEITEDESSHSRSESESKSSSESEKEVLGTLTVEDLQSEATMSAAVVAQYAADNIEEESWQSVKETVDNGEELTMVVVEDENGVAYHYEDAEQSPYYRLQGAENEEVTFYSDREEQVEKVAITKLVSDVNKKHTNKSINNVKTKTKIETGKEKKKAESESEKESSKPTEKKAEKSSEKESKVISGNADEVFKSINKEYIFAAGAGGWSSQMTIATDGTFTGKGADSNYDSVSKWSFNGTFGNVNKVSDKEYTMDIVKFSKASGSKREFVQDGQKRYEEVIDPWGIAANEKAHVYLPGYSINDLPEDVRGWVNGSYGKSDMTKLDVPLVIIDNKGYKDYGGAPWIAKPNN